MIPKYSLFSVS